MPSAQAARSQVMASDSHNSRTSLIGSNRANKPIGIRLFGLCFRFDSLANKRTHHKILVLLMTYLAYTAFHMGRRPLSIVKNVLNQNCTGQQQSSADDVGPTTLPPAFAAAAATDQQHWSAAPVPIEIDMSEQQPPVTSHSPAAQIEDGCHSWAPFDNDQTANQLLALLDSAFLASYALSMFFSGMIAERMNLRYFLTLGSCLSGLGLIAFGLARPLSLHSMGYFVAIQLASGAAQSIGWPVVVTCVSNWFEPNKLGTIYGVWNSHTNVGNILGATIAGFFVEKDWGLSFIVPGCLMVGVGLIMFLFLVPEPQDVELEPLNPSLQSSDGPLKHGGGRPPVASSLGGADYQHQHRIDGGLSPYAESGDQPPKSLRHSGSRPDHEMAVSFLTALKIPGVIEFSVCLFFSKLVSYTFLYWLPRYITSSTSNNSESSAYLSVPFDVGGVAGAILAGYISDRYRANAITCNTMLLLAIPAMLAYQKLGALSTMHNILLQLLAGALVNGPYCLITTAVSADLSQRVTDGKAMATVSAIIDGMGSVGAVLGPLFAGFVSNSGDWQAVFLMLILSDILAALCLTRITISEIKQKLANN